MKIGVMMHLTAHTVSPAVLAVEAESRGFDSMFVTEHTHIPVRPFIRWSGGNPMPEEYKRLHDPMVALATAAAATSRIRLGTGVLVVGQRDPLTLAKQLASLDRLAGGRLVVGTGYGWLRDELANHGVAWRNRRMMWCEHLQALTTLWRDDEARFADQHVRFGPVWSYPKPVQRPRPTVLLGAAGSDTTLRDVVEHVDGWMPIEGTEQIADSRNLRGPRDRRSDRRTRRHHRPANPTRPPPSLAHRALPPEHPVTQPDSTIGGVEPLIDEHTPARRSAQRLRNTLRVNTATSFTGGFAAAVAAEPVSHLLGTTDHTVWIRVVGVGLCAFAIGVIVVAGARISRLLRWTPAITTMDAGWVAASIATVTLGWYSTSGAIVIALVAGVVGYLAIRQTTSLRRTRALVRDRLAHINETPPVEVVHVEHRIACDTATAWDVITDHELYGRLALNLSCVHTTDSNGPDLARTCTNRKGEHWHETCTLWDDQHRYEVAVDTTNYPYPLDVMRGAWYVEPDEPGHVVVGMDFQLQPRRSVWGRTFAAAMHAAFPFILRRIIRGWRNEIASRSAPRTGRS